MAASRTIEEDRNHSLDSQLTAYSAAAEAELALDAGRAKRPNRSIVAYSAAAAGAGLLGALNVDAAIVHNDNGGAGWTLSAGKPTQTINFNADATSDARLVWLSTYNTALIQGRNGGERVHTGANNARRFTAGQTISTGAGTWQTFVGTIFMYNAGWTNGNFTDVNTGYLGLRFNDGGTKYAWVHIDSIAANGSQYHVDGYAYQTDGSPIQAGEMPVPEPSTIALALLASGAAGVMRSRRKKILKGRK